MAELNEYGNIIRDVQINFSAKNEGDIITVLAYTGNVTAPARLQQSSPIIKVKLSTENEITLEQQTFNMPVESLEV